MHYYLYLLSDTSRNQVDLSISDQYTPVLHGSAIQFSSKGLKQSTL